MKKKNNFCTKNRGKVDIYIVDIKVNDVQNRIKIEVKQIFIWLFYY